MANIAFTDGESESARCDIISALVAQGGGMEICVEKFRKMTWTTETPQHVVYADTMGVFKVTPSNCSTYYNVSHLVNALITGPKAIKGDTGDFGMEKMNLGAMHSRSTFLIGYLLAHDDYETNYIGVGYGRNFMLNGNTMSNASLQVAGIMSMFSVLASGGEIEIAYSLCSNMRKLSQGKKTRKVVDSLV